MQYNPNLWVRFSMRQKTVVVDNAVLHATTFAIGGAAISREDHCAQRRKFIGMDKSSSTLIMNDKRSDEPEAKL